jgi:N-hydroxyarylamine O-acetyltransferase
MAPDLDAYFARIAYTGPRTPTLETLRALQALHPAALPFENLSPLLGQRVRLELDAIEAKLVAAGRGGYCYEHNILFRAVLDALGFKTRALAARVVWGPPVDALPARTHALTLVEIDDQAWIADVGFGGVTLTAPLRLQSGLVQDTPHERFRLDLTESGDYLLQVELGAVWAPVYRFDLVVQLDADYAVSNFYVNSHPESLFVHNLLAARALPGVRYTLFNGVMSTYAPTPSHRNIRDVSELRQILQENFAISLPVCDAELDAVLARCLTSK